MAEVTAGMVKELRDRTGAGMMDCKKALAENNTDIEAAVDWLRKKGLAAAAKKAGRTAAEGLVFAKSYGKSGALLEVNAETDFVGRNDLFQNYVKELGDLCHKSQSKNIEDIKSLKMGSAGRNADEELTNLISVIGENMSLRRVEYLSVNQGIVCAYTHSAVCAGIGRIGVLVALESSSTQETKLLELGKQLAMHVAATKPQVVSREDMPAEVIEREKMVLVEQARASGKPEQVIEKMVEGRLQKFFAEVVFLEQLFVIDGETKVSEVLSKASKDLGASVKVSGFKMFILGEGIEKQQIDFAAEVAAQVK
ncbi:MAG: translation elongation factor Ts [Holosporales bacterium]|jgi:elongation factor Ts|nr:translation elongation factor Ts [Holosporales bacterium]